MSRQTPRGRRAALPPPERVARGLRARLNLTAVLAVLLPALTIGALALVRPASVDVSTYPPRETGLNLSILTCPSSLDDTGDVSVASATGLAGQVEVTQSGAASTTEVDVPADRPATADAGSRGLTVRGVDDMAPGLLASRQGEGPAAVSCRAPVSEQWFTGLGAAARHSSVLELVNPDPGPAVADITVIGARGPVDAPSLRGITVPGGRSLRLDLAQEIPMRGELSAHVVVSRGRLGVYAADTFDELGRGDAGTDWLAAQEPGVDLLMLGLPTGTGTRSLVVANDGVDEARVVIRVVTKDSAFRPEGLDDVTVPPGSVTRVPLSAILGAAVRDGALGVQVESTHPVTATLQVVRRRRRLALGTPPRGHRGDPGHPARGALDRAALLRRRRLGRGAGPAGGRQQEGAGGRPRPRAHGRGPAPRGRHAGPGDAGGRSAARCRRQPGRGSGGGRPARPGAHRPRRRRQTRPAVTLPSLRRTCEPIV